LYNPATGMCLSGEINDGRLVVMAICNLQSPLQHWKIEIR